jgi:hypothetical protein
VPEIDLKTLERTSAIIGVATELGIKIRGNVGRCFRSERHPDESEAPTLFFNAAKNIFFCKTCSDVGGSVIDLVSQVQGWDREQAVDWLAHRSEFDQLTRQRYHGKGKKKP